MRILALTLALIGCRTPPLDPLDAALPIAPSDMAVRDFSTRPSDLAVPIADLAQPLFDFAIAPPDFSSPCDPLGACITDFFAKLDACCPSTTTCNHELDPVLHTDYTCSSGCTVTVRYDNTVFVQKTTTTWASPGGTCAVETEYLDRTGTHTRTFTGFGETIAVNGPGENPTCGTLSVPNPWYCNNFSLDNTPSLVCRSPEPGCTLPGLDH